MPCAPLSPFLTLSPALAAMVPPPNTGPATVPAGAPAVPQRRH